MMIISLMMKMTLQDNYKLKMMKNNKKYLIYAMNCIIV